jgi:beta-mannosidase
MRFRVNGASFVARGANMIPMEELEARQSDAAYVALLESAAAAGMNMLRVWGGGI